VSGPSHQAVWWAGSSLTSPGANPPEAISCRVAVLVPWVERSLAERALRAMAWRAGLAATYVAIQDDAAAGPLALLNAALAHIDSEAVVYAAQDAFPGRYWLQRASACLGADPRKGLLAFNDGKWFGHLAGFGMVRRRWLQGVYGGSLFHPGYRQHFGDTELSVVALQHGGLAYDPHALLVEVDPDKDSRTVNVQDRALYATRRRTGFDARVSDVALLDRFA